MKTLIFATHNDHKVQEINAILNNQFKIQSLKSLGLMNDIYEPFNNVLDNAKEKARVVHRWTEKNCFSEDTGLFVDALNGEPGARSARYASDHDFAANIDKLLNNLNGEIKRDAYFLTVICLIFDKKEYIFDGKCPGKITTKRIGNRGFGYDSVFLPDGSDKTFAQMSTAEKSRFSHRRKAFDKLTAFLLNQNSNKAGNDF